MLTFDEAKGLRHGQTIYHTVYKNADGTPQRWRVNGQVKLWKRSPNHIKVPLKHGLRTYDYLHEDNLSDFSLHEQE